MRKKLLAAFLMAPLSLCMLCGTYKIITEKPAILLVFLVVGAFAYGVHLLEEE